MSQDVSISQSQASDILKYATRWEIAEGKSLPLIASDKLADIFNVPKEERVILEGKAVYIDPAFGIIFQNYFRTGNLIAETSLTKLEEICGEKWQDIPDLSKQWNKNSGFSHTK